MGYYSKRHGAQPQTMGSTGRSYYRERHQAEIPVAENVLQRALKQGVSQGFKTVGAAMDIGAPQMSDLNPMSMKNQARSKKSEALGNVIKNPLLKFGADVATDPDTWFGGGAAAKAKVFSKGAPKASQGLGQYASKVGSKIKNVFNAPKRAEALGSEIASLKGEVALGEASSLAPNMARKGEAIAKTASKNVTGDLESGVGELEKQSRNVFAQHSPVAKQRLKDLTKKTYDTYGQILKEGEDEALQRGMDADLYREQVIDPVLRTIETTGAKTPSAQKLTRLFRVKEGLGDTALEKADEAVLRNFDNLSSVEKMKALRSSIYKEGSEDFIQTQFSDLHQKFIGQFSPKVSEANKAYGPMKQALRWGSKNIKQFNEHEVKRVTDIVQKANRGQLDETTKAYLETLKKGSGKFKGSDITKLSESHQKTLDALESQINSAKEMIKKVESQHLEDVSKIRLGGMESTLGKQNILQQSAAKKARIAELKKLKEVVDRDVRTRDDLIRYGIITGLSSAGVGTGVYALARALHE